jgi:hypothetical protein
VLLVGQAEHAAGPTVPLKRPGEQGLHRPLLDSVCPIEHKHASGVVLCGGDSELAGQFTQLAAPVKFLKVFACN